MLPRDEAFGATGEIIGASLDVVKQKLHHADRPHPNRFASLTGEGVALFVLSQISSVNRIITEGLPSP